MRVGIYGGCFNPIHFGHMSLIDEVSDKFNLDKVIFVPNLNPYYKVHREIKFEDVSSMIRLAMKDNILFQISDLESSTKEEHFTFNTITELLEQHSNERLFLIVGSDQFLQMKSWYKFDEINKIVDVIVPIRAPYLIDSEQIISTKENYLKLKLYKDTMFFKNENNKVLIFYDLIKKIDISSSQLIEYINLGDFDKLKKFIPLSLIEFIVENRLYK